MKTPTLSKIIDHFFYGWQKWDELSMTVYSDSIKLCSDQVHSIKTFTQFVY